MTRADRRIAVGLFIVTFVTYAWFFGGGGWHQNANFDLARALVERQTLHIDGYRVNTGDVSWSPVGGEWHAYINKPPGASFLAAIPYAIVYGVDRALGVSVDSWKGITINAYVVTLLTCGVCGALIPALLYAYARRRADASPFRAASVALAIAFGTIVFPYSTMLFAHVPSAFFLLLAFVWIDDHPLLGGVAAGIAGLVSYICIPAAIVIAVLCRARRDLLRYIAGGIPFAIVLGLYHEVCFGSPFRTSLEVSKQFTEKDRLFGVLGYPRLDAFRGITIGEAHGLFAGSPVLLLAIAGAVVMFRRRMMLRELAVIGGIAAIFILFNASFNGWTGGLGFGPRYLLPIVPLMAIPMLFVRVGRAGAVVIGLLATASVVIQFLATATNPMPPGDIEHPVRDYFLSAGISSNAQSMDELTGDSLYPPGSHESVWASFNLGEALFGAGRRSSVLPIVVWMFAVSAWIVRQT